MVRHSKLEHASKCLIRWSPVHCLFDKRSKGIISTIGNLEKPLILPNFAKICTFNFRDYSTFRHTSWYHSVRLIVSCLSPLLEIKGQSLHVNFIGYHIYHLSKHFHKVYQKVSLHVILLFILLYCIQVELDDKWKPKRTLHIKNILVATSSGYNITEMGDT